MWKVGVQAQEEHANSMQKDHSLGFELRTVLLQGNNCVTAFPNEEIQVIYPVTHSGEKVKRSEYQTCNKSTTLKPSA